MKKIENLNLENLSKEDSLSYNGGWFIGVGGAWDLSRTFEGFADGFMAAYDQYSRNL